MPFMSSPDRASDHEVNQPLTATDHWRIPYQPLEEAEDHEPLPTLVLSTLQISTTNPSSHRVGSGLADIEPRRCPNSFRGGGGATREPATSANDAYFQDTEADLLSDDVVDKEVTDSWLDMTPADQHRDESTTEEPVGRPRRRVQVDTQERSSALLVLGTRSIASTGDDTRQDRPEAGEQSSVVPAGQGLRGDISHGDGA